MKKLTELHQSFITNANKPMIPGEFPILPIKTQMPIVPTNKWSMIAKKTLKKVYEFRTIDQRNQYMLSMFEYEDQVMHHATFVINEKTVCITVMTKNIESVTEIDKEYAAYSDSVYKDVCFNISSKDDE